MKSPQQPLSEADYQGLQSDDPDQGAPQDYAQDGKQEVAAKGCRDPAFAVAFLATAGAMVYYATQGGQLVFEMDPDCISSESVTNDGVEDDDVLCSNGIDDLLWDDDISGQVGKLASCLLGIAVFSVLMCTVWMGLIMKYPENYITCGFYTKVGLIAVCCALAFTFGQVVIGMISAFILMLMWCYWRRIKARIPFAAANLATACTALNAHKSVMCVVILMILLSLAWSFTVSLASVAIFNNLDQTSGSFGMIVFLVLVAYFWGGMICANVSHVTIAGTVGSWWFSPPEDASSSYAVTSSFTRAMTSSFGSIAFGSLLVAILEAIKVMCREMQNQNNAALACCATCIIGCIEGLVRYINRYAFCYVGLYGHDFCSAGSHVFGLLNHRGWWTTVINDDLIGNALNLGAFVIGIVCAVFGLGVAVVVFDAPADATISYTLIIYGFIMGFVMAGVTANSVYSSVATVFVAFAESHEALQNNHPDTFLRLYEAWNQFHPRLVAFIVVQQQAPYGEIYSQGEVQETPVVSAVHVNQNGEPIY